MTLVMASRTTAERCLAVLEDAEELCQETDVLRLRIETTQLALWPELYGLLELFSELDQIITRLHRFNGTS